MTRGEFSIALAGAVAVLGSGYGKSSRVVTLRAIAGPRLPEILRITASSPDELRGGLWELRTYKEAEPVLASQLAGVFPRAGIRPVLDEADGSNLTYLIRFENLTARDRAWTLLNADPQWMGVRAHFRSYHFGLYEVV